MAPRALSPTVWVSPQLALAEIAGLADLGIRRVVCNRPDAEDAGQPAAFEVETAARAAAMDFVWIPITGMPGPDQVAAVAACLDDGVSTVMYCRSGMRSTTAWALSERGRGVDADALRATAAGAGYDLSRLPL